jgi:hypothetical protein
LPKFEQALGQRQSIRALPDADADIDANATVRQRAVVKNVLSRWRLIAALLHRACGG